MRFPRILALLVAVATCFSVHSTASAVTTPASGAAPDLEVAAGAPVRPLRTVLWDQAPASTRAAWERFLSANGPNWHATFDRHTAVPSRVWGEGIATPGAMASAVAGEAYARAFLIQHIDLLAPGAGAGDFVLAANDLDDLVGMRTIGYWQFHKGTRVLSGQVSFRFKNDRLFVIGSEALPNVSVTIPARTIDDEAARAGAAAWEQGTVKAGAVTGPFVLPLVRDAGVDYAAVLAVDVRAEGGAIGHWTVYVDAATGAAVARRSLIRWADGTVLYNAGQRHPLGTRIDYPAEFGAFTINGSSATSTIAGGVTWSGTATANITTTVTGPYVRVLHDQGAEITAAQMIDPAGTLIWNRADSEFDDAQLSAFIHANKVKDWARIVSPTMSWLDNQIQVTVNINDVCNAFSDGDSINFFEQNSSCANTGRLADVVYHEFGHSYHAHAIIPGVGDWGDGSLGEGIGDILAATIQNDHGMGRGFFHTDAPLRDCGPNRVWPDDINPDIHETGLIYCGAMWDLRDNLIASMGMTDGVAQLDFLIYEGIRRAVDIPSTYTEVLAADDDDGNLTNGTPHMCDINAAFELHGLAPPGVEGGPGVQTPILAGMEITLPVVASALCPGTNVTSAQIAWRLRSNTAVTGAVDMSQVGEDWIGTLPQQPSNNVLQYTVTATLGNGTTISFPDNPADPRYELFIGPVIPLYCTDFEGAAAPDGWTHALDMGMMQEGADDWMWGPPLGTPGSGDPGQAYSGTNVYGNDLGGGNYNGMYQDNKVNHLLSPTIDTMGHTFIRLQYRRWLNVEDGQYDQANIYGNDQIAWGNLFTPDGTTHHTDKEWRFHDVDLSSMVAGGMINVKFEIRSDGGLQMGGWTIDDLCVVAYEAADPVCGNGFLEGPEECDDGNTTDGDGCAADCTNEGPPPNCGDGVLDSDEECDDGNMVDDDECRNDCSLPGTMMEGDGSTCGCRTGGAGGSAAGGIILFALVALAFRRRGSR